jgi:hypothetical protein
MWIEAVEDILAAKQRLEVLPVEERRNYHLWNSSLHKFVNPFAEAGFVLTISRFRRSENEDGQPESECVNPS